MAIDVQVLINARVNKPFHIKTYNIYLPFFAIAWKKSFCKKKRSMDLHFAETTEVFSYFGGQRKKWVFISASS